MLREREKEGVDFWWLDWQQGEEFVKIPLVNPTFLLNYIFFNSTPKNDSVSSSFFVFYLILTLLILQIRPLILHRWGGLGNHRYQVGFSGDVVPVRPFFLMIFAL